MFIAPLRKHFQRSKSTLDSLKSVLNVFGRKLPWVPEDNFFLSILMVRGEAPREKNNVSGALSNRKHDLFYIRYFEDGPLEPG